jgi:hypothetical protein
VDGDQSVEPAFMIGTISPEDAAGAYAQQRIEQSEGAWTEGAIRVWRGDADGAVFDVIARFMANDDDEEMIDCELEIIARD